MKRYNITVSNVNIRKGNLMNKAGKPNNHLWHMQKWKCILDQSFRIHQVTPSKQKPTLTKSKESETLCKSSLNHTSNVFNWWPGQSIVNVISTSQEYLSKPSYVDIPKTFQKDNLYKLITVHLHINSIRNILNFQIE